MDKQTKTYLIQGALFITTLITTTLTGLEWSVSKYLISGISWEEFASGFAFSIPFLGILTFHEFGHYFTAKYHKIKVTLPYYIPLWFGFLGLPSLGTMGAFIRIQEQISSRKKYFDVGVSGPIAGFVVAIICFVVGFRTLPETSYIYEIHPEYEVFGAEFEEKMEGLDTLILKKDLNPSRMNYEFLPDTIKTQRGSIAFGDNLLMKMGRKYIAPADRYIPSSNEIMHYPLLLASFLAFFFTALNLLPMGQLDGGHILFGLVGRRYHALTSRVIFTGFIFYAGLGMINVASLQNTSIQNVIFFLLEIAAYLYFLYVASFSVFKERKDRLLFATILFTAQFFVSSLFEVEGYVGWLLFSLVIGRFIGVDHPYVSEDLPLSPGRKILGWVALAIFVLCFSPQPLVFEGL
ncbi:MAG: site-2 protease family protein [Bacteroidota bacterium]